jgi:hypothetical protein
VTQNLIPPGALFLASTGAHRDYSTKGIFRALQPITPEVIAGEFRWAHGRLGDFTPDRFLAWAFRRGVFEQVDAVALHIDWSVSDLRLDPIGPREYFL